MGFASLEWLFPVLLILHNTEEAIWLPAWAKRTGFWRGDVSAGSFRFAVVVLTVLGSTVTWVSVRSGGQTLSTYLAFGFMAALFGNAVMHLGISIARRDYMPGVATAVVLNLPILSFLLVSAVGEGQVSVWPAMASVAVVSGFLLASIPALFKVGRILKL